jgi:hypothetical protein
MAVSWGFLMGGGSMFGADVEYLFAKNRWGVQAGAGLIGVGAGINYHLKPSISSSFLSVQYWNMWLFSYTSYVVPMFTFRYKKFQVSAGCGIALPVGKYTREGGTLVPLINIGGYVPFSSKLLIPSEETSASRQKNKAVSVGIGMGGSVYGGAEVEYMLPSSRWGMQAGAGLVGVSAGVNYHLKPRINSSFASIQYWWIRVPGSTVAVVGPLLAYRAPKHFQAGLGFSYALYHGADVSASERYKYYWLINIGAYFPW